MQIIKFSITHFIMSVAITRIKILMLSTFILRQILSNKKILKWINKLLSIVNNKLTMNAYKMIEGNNALFVLILL